MVARSVATMILIHKLLGDRRLPEPFDERLLAEGCKLGALAGKGVQLVVPMVDVCLHVLAPATTFAINEPPFQVGGDANLHLFNIGLICDARCSCHQIVDVELGAEELPRDAQAAAFLTMFQHHLIYILTGHCMRDGLRDGFFTRILASSNFILAVDLDDFLLLLHRRVDQAFLRLLRSLKGCCDVLRGIRCANRRWRLEVG